MYTDILVLLKVILGMDATDVSKDPLLNFYMIKAKNAILSYCLIVEADYWLANLTNQTAELALFYYNSKKNIGTKSKSSGVRSYTYTDDAIPKSIGLTLPLPQITLR